MNSCKMCGACCINNGLIPPLVPGHPDDANAPAWLQVLVKNLRRHFGDASEDYPCVFLDERLQCAIHDLKPSVCRKFSCEADAAGGE